LTSLMTRRLTHVMIGRVLPLPSSLTHQVPSKSCKWNQQLADCDVGLHGFLDRKPKEGESLRKGETTLQQVREWSRGHDKFMRWLGMKSRERVWFHI
jgi:hypothetical protein